MAAAAMAAPLRAQANTSAAVDIAGEGAAGRGGEYRDRDIFGLRLAASIRLRRSPGIDVFGEMAAEGLGAFGYDAICQISVRGGCVPEYPALAGIAATAGVLAHVGNGVELRLGSGGGVFRMDDRGRTRVGGIVGQFDAAWFLFEHVGMVAGSRLILLPSFRHDRLVIAPFGIGARFR